MKCHRFRRQCWRFGLSFETASSFCLETFFRVDWKCRTWKWRTIKIAGHEIAGRENDESVCMAWNCKTWNYKTGNCKTWKCRTKNDDRAWNGMLNLYSVYSASNVRRLCALLCPAISFLHFHVLQFHVLHFHVLRFQSVIFMSCNFMPCKLVRHFHVRHFQRPRSSVCSCSDCSLSETVNILWVFTARLWDCMSSVRPSVCDDQVQDRTKVTME